MGCKLVGLSKENSPDIIGVSGSYACTIFISVTSSEAGTWRIHTGIAAQNGISSALLAKSGLKGPPTALEGKRGFFFAFGEKEFDKL